MKEGRLIKKTRDYSRYEVNDFFDKSALKKFKENRIKSYSTCGSAALSVVTGIPPNKIDKYLPKNQDCWSDRALCKFLKQRNYKVLPITRSDVTSTNFISRLITPGHVLITGQDVCQTPKGEREGSWFVIYQNLLFHNFEVQDLSPLEFINHPTQCVYLIYHSKWHKKGKNKII